MAQASIRTGHWGALGNEGLLARRAAGHRRKILPLGLLALGLLVVAMLASSSAPSGGLSAWEGRDAPEAAAALGSQPAAASPEEKRGVLDAYGKLPLSFVANAGQKAEEAVRYYAQGAGYGFYFSPKGAMLSFSEGERGHALGLDFVGADPDVAIEPSKELPGKANYLLGNDPAKWQTGLSTHEELLYRGL